MKRAELYEALFASPMYSEWHWFAWHFDRFRVDGVEHPFARSVLDACQDVDAVIPGYALAFLDRLARVTGPRSDTDHRDYLFQLLAELLVIRQVVTWSWGEKVGFVAGARGPGSRRDIELLIQTEQRDIGVEVKAPTLSEHAAGRASRRVQLTSRLAKMAPAGHEFVGVTLPRDNPVKDFLASANAKFEPFGEAATKERPFHGVLVVV